LGFLHFGIPFPSFCPVPIVVSDLQHHTATPKRAKPKEQYEVCGRQIQPLLVAVAVTFTPLKKPSCIWQLSALPRWEVDGRTIVKNRFGLFFIVVVS
jgi:hypothetical protein